MNAETHLGTINFNNYGVIFSIELCEPRFIGYMQHNVWLIFFEGICQIVFIVSCTSDLRVSRLVGNIDIAFSEKVDAFALGEIGKDPTKGYGHNCIWLGDLFNCEDIFDVHPVVTGGLGPSDQ
ncbi:MAG: hypothetical protein ACYS76_11940 [Planctomycetota bacterium]